MTAELNQTAEMAAKFQLKYEVVKRYKAVFDEYDKEQEGTVPIKDLPTIFKTLRGTITEAEVNEILGDKVLPAETDLESAKLKFEDFLALLVYKEEEMIMKEYLMESFRVFDPEGTGFIPLNYFRYLMKTYGTPLSEEEIEEMMKVDIGLIKDSDPEEGNVKYYKFVNLMLGIS